MSHQNISASSSSSSRQPSPLPLTQASLAQLAHPIPTRPPRWTSVGSYSRRVSSVTPSLTSVSDGEGDDSGYGREREARDAAVVEVELGRWSTKVKGKGKASASRVAGSEEQRSGVAGELIPEILVHILYFLPDSRDLLSAVQVNRQWCLASFSLLWHKPLLPSVPKLSHLGRIISSPSTSLPYSNSIRRLHLNSLSKEMTDDLFLPFANCRRVERLTMVGSCAHLSSGALRKVLGGMVSLNWIDLTGVEGVDDSVLEVLGRSCPKLQGAHLGGCKGVGDEGIEALAKGCMMLRRLKVYGCHRITDMSIITLSQSCPNLLELDFSDLPQLQDPSIRSIFQYSHYLREIRLNGNTNITSAAIPDRLNPPSPSLNLDDFDLSLDDTTIPPWFTGEIMENLRIVDLTGCKEMEDEGIEVLIRDAPKLRNLTLAKCGKLTDKSLESVGRLGKHLHYLHLGHVKELSDAAVSKLTRSCTRLRYIDLACCENLTDLSVLELAANLPKLRRIGLVKVKKITDEGIFALAERHASLERMHLSYCENVSVRAITFLLNRLLHLTHLSLTGISAFKTAELQQFCRIAPADFNEHQLAAFCVYSGHGIANLRDYLNLRQSTLDNFHTSDGESTRRDSTSSTSSITIPGAYSPTPGYAHYVPSITLPAPIPQHLTQGREPVVGRRGSAPIFRSAGSGGGGGGGGSGWGGGGGLGGAFASVTPNFLAGYTVETNRMGGSRRSSREVERSSGRSFREVERDVHGETRESRGIDIAEDRVQKGVVGSRSSRRAMPVPPSSPVNIRSGSGSGSGTGAGTGTGTSPLKWLTGNFGWGSGGTAGGEGS